MAPEECWLPVPDWEMYDVSDQGRVRSWMGIGGAAGQRSSRARLLKPADNGGGYLTVVLGGKGGPRKSVHCLVAAAFFGPVPEGQEVCHKNGKNGENHVGNLRYGTRSSNQQDKVAHGTDNRGQKHYAAKLTDAQVFDIRALASAGHTHADLASRFGVSQPHVTNIVKFKRRGGDHSHR